MIVKNFFYTDAFGGGVSVEVDGIPVCLRPTKTGHLERAGYAMYVFTDPRLHPFKGFGLPEAVVKIDGEDDVYDCAFKSSKLAKIVTEAGRLMRQGRFEVGKELNIEPIELET